MKEKTVNALRRTSVLLFITLILFALLVPPSYAATLEPGHKGSSYVTYLGKSKDGKYFTNQDNHSLKQIKYTIKIGGRNVSGYCMSPGKGFQTGVSYTSKKYSSAAAWKALSEKKRELLALSMFYGYNAGMNSPFGNTNDYYEATQVMVWESVDGDVKINDSGRGITTSRKHTHYKRISGHKYAISCYEKIKDRIRAHLKGASFTAKKKADADTYVLEYDYKTKKFKKDMKDKNKDDDLKQKLLSDSTDGLKMSERNKDGEYTFTASKAGTYTAVLANDVSAKTSQPLIVLQPSRNSVQNIIVGAADDTVFYAKFRTEKKGKAKITKTSEDGRVKGFRFRLTCEDNGFDQTFTTNAKGIINEDLYPGKYKITEVLTDAQKTAGYEAKSSTVTVREGETSEVKVKNTRITKSLKVVKTSDNGVVKGFTFRIKGASGNMTKYDRTFTTDANGVIATDLYPGTYTLTEVLTASQKEEGYLPADPVTFEIKTSTSSPYTVKVHNTVKETRGLRIIKAVEDEAGPGGFEFSITGRSGYKTYTKEELLSAISPVVSEVTDVKGPEHVFDIRDDSVEMINSRIKEGETGTVTVDLSVRYGDEEKMLPVNIEISGYGGDNKTVSKEAEGIRYNDISLAAAVKTVEYTGVTDRYGRIDIEDPMPGHYEVTEVLSDGQKERYLQPETKTVDISDGKNELVYVHVTNIPLKEKIRIKKTSTDPDDTVSGIVFSVTGETAWGDEIEPEEYETDENGYIDMELVPGTYVFTEEDLDTTRYQEVKPQTVEITADDCRDDVVMEISFVNRPYTPVSVSKIDATTGAELPGASMSLTDPETGTVIDEWISEDTPHTIEGLVYGKRYVLHEDTAPIGYQLAHDMEITAGSDEKIEVVDQPTVLFVRKTDGETGESLFGAEFSILDAETEEEVRRFTLSDTDEGVYAFDPAGNRIDKVPVIGGEETEDDGYGCITGLEEGREYIIREIKAPAGYEKCEEETFVFKNGKKIKIDDFRPSIHTVASDTRTGTHMALADEEAKVVDEVSYENLAPGEEYSLTGTLVDADTEEVIAVSDEVRFTAAESEGEQYVEIKLGAESLAGRNTVIYEELKKDEKTVAVHKEKTSKEQSIIFPKISTTAYEKESGEGSVVYDGEITIVDDVRYMSITAGSEYVLKGSLINKTTGRSVAESETSFTAEKSDGKVSVEFDVHPRPDTDYVAFEELYVKDEKGKLKLIAVHKDIDSEDQTVRVTSPFKTGDTTGLFSWLVMLVTACSLIALAILKRVKDNRWT